MWSAGLYRFYFECKADFPVVILISRRVQCIWFIFVVAVDATILYRLWCLSCSENDYSIGNCSSWKWYFWNNSLTSSYFLETSIVISRTMFERVFDTKRKGLNSCSHSRLFLSIVCKCSQLRWLIKQRAKVATCLSKKVKKWSFEPGEWNQKKPVRWCFLISTSRFHWLLLIPPSWKTFWPHCPNTTALFVVIIIKYLFYF